MDEGILLLFGGVGLFLVGMHLMDSALSHLAGRGFKLLLRRNTAGNARAVATGVVTTAVLQSSSIVSFLTLAFAGSGLIRLQNALGVILGANIGTTVSNWFITTVGFTLDIDIIWYPLLGVTGFVLVLFERYRKTEQAAFFTLGLTFLFISLEWMKEGMEGTVTRFDFSAYRHLPPLVFILIGFILTFLIQSSNATVAITLSALHARAIPFELAVAVVIGSELGTSMKLVLAAIGGAPEKKRLAAGNILLNLLTTVLAAAFMYPLIRVVREGMGIGDPLLGLVAFQMLINTGAVLAFLPFLNTVSRRLERLFGDNGMRATLYIDQRVPAVAGFAQEIFRLEAFYFLKRVLAYNAAGFRLPMADIGLEDMLSERELRKERSLTDPERRYAEIKQAQGEMIEYFVRLEKGLSDRRELAANARLMRSVQGAMHAAKGFKDIGHNREELLQSGNDLKYGQFAHFSDTIRDDLSRMAAILSAKETDAPLQARLEGLLQAIQEDYGRVLQGIYTEAGRDTLPEKDISTLQNMNRELFSANRAMIYALGDYLLDEEAAEALRSLPMNMH